MKRIHEKRKQVRKTIFPVLLAVEYQWTDAVEEFDLALFGHKCELVDPAGQVKHTFEADGLFCTRSGKSSNFAGILAFWEVGFKSLSGPALYLTPQFQGQLPHVLSAIERRRCERGLGVRSNPADPSLTATLSKLLGFVKE